MLVATLLLALLTALHAAEAPASQTAVVTIHPEKPGVKIPADFLGFSFEKKMLSIEAFHPANVALINLFTNLGGGVLRVGANEGDTTFWSRTEMKPLSKQKSLGYSLKPLTIGPLSLDNLYAFAKRSGWRVIHGLNLGTVDPVMAADEAAYALQVGGPLVLALEIGNEPNLYRSKPPQVGLRPAKYNYDQYRKELESYHQEILKKLPRAPLAGPTTTRFCDWLPKFVKDFKDQTALVTSHGYALSGSETNQQSVWFASVENLMRPQKDKEEVWLPKLEAAKAAGLSFRLDEYNTCTSGGRVGVSDVFASALWNLDFMLEIAAHGAAGVNVHGGFGARPGYSPLSYRDNHYVANPIYYSMLMFHQAARGQLVTVDCQSAANFVAHAVQGDDRKLRIVLINKDLKQTVVASVVTGVPHTKATVMRLSAPSATATEGVTLAGSAVAKDGTWSPQPGAPVPCVNGKCEVTMPAASAALLTLE
jgi:hypothetical protein